MKITVEEIRRRLLEGFGYLDSSLKDIIVPWLQDEVTFSWKGVTIKMERWELFEIYNKTICQNVVASNAIEGEEVYCDEFYMFVHFIDQQIKKRFIVVPIGS